MDRNVVIATVLIAIIMMVWLVWLAPPAPPTPVQDGNVATDTQAAAQAPLPEEEPESLARQTRPLPVTDSTIAGAQQGTERFITVDTDLYRARFSTKGATLKSFILKKYDKFDQETPVQLADTSGPGALGLAFTTPSNHLVDTRSFFFDADFTGDTLRVRENPVELIFETAVGAGTIRQTYTFKPGEYEVDLQVEQENAASFATGEGYELIWEGGVPFTEGNLEDEARHAGAYASSGGEVEYIDLVKQKTDVQRLAGSVSWVSVKNKYFTAVMMPQGETRGAELEGEQFGTLDGGDLRENYTARLLMPSSQGADLYQLYIGPLEFYRITDYDRGLYDMVDYGYDFFEWMTRPVAKFIFIPLFTLLGKFIPNYGIVIIIFSILIKLALYPLTKSSYVNMARMRELQPKMEAIKEKYGDNPQKQQEATMKMYKETGINPLGGCMPMLLQWPILIALYQFIPQSIELRQAGFLWANDLSAPDAILHLPFTIPFYGDFVAGFTLLMGLSMIVQMKLQTQPSTNPQAKIMTFVFPVMIFAIFNRFASGLSLYYLVYNVISAIQQKSINRSLEKKHEAGEDGKVNGKPDRKTSLRNRLTEQKDGKARRDVKPSKKART